MTSSFQKTSKKASEQTIHGSACILGRYGVLVIGVSGSGKSTLVNHLVESHPPPNLFGCWVGDDRIRIDWHNDILVAHPASSLEGLFERYYSGIESVDFLGSACIDVVVELLDSPPRMSESLFWEGTNIPLIRVPSCSVEVSAPLVMNFLSGLELTS